MALLDAETPGLFASSDTVRQAQQAANRHADRQTDPARTAADLRELRQRAFIRSAVLWAVIGIPMLCGLIAFVLSSMLGLFAASIVGPSLIPG